MGVVNVTPDSFSDGGMWLQPEDAVAHGLTLLADGADLIDVGGESTRPGAARVDEDEELARVVPVVMELASAGATVSVDTMRPRVADAALGAGAALVNDVSGGLADPGMLSLVGSAQVPYVIMHWRRHSADMQAFVSYDDVVEDVRRELAERVTAATGAGVDPDRVVVDPGFGFAKQAGHNWTLLARLEALHELGRPLLVGASRKSFLGRMLGGAAAGAGGTSRAGGAGGAGDTDRPALQRDDATTATTVLAAASGAWCVRVHEVRGSADAVRVVARTAAG